MKLFKITNERTTAFTAKTIYECEMIDETVEYLLNADDGKTLQRIRYLIANLYNNHTFPNVELFTLLREADTEHEELVMDILGISQSKYGQSCFLMINDLAPKIIKKFKLREED